MKATLEFNLPEEQEEFESMRNGMRWEHVVWQVDNYLRNEIKYKDNPDPTDKALQDVRDFIYHRLTEEGLTLR